MPQKGDIRSKVAAVINQHTIPVSIGSKTFQVAPPCLGTLIEISEMISSLPAVEKGSKETLMGFVLARARSCGVLPNIYAMLILGPKGYRKRGALGLGKRKGPALAREIADTVPPKECREGVERILYGLQMDDFFAITTFLKGVEVTKPTKVVTEATASGQR